MKTNRIIKIIAACAVIFVSSCEKINKISETDIAVGDFSFNIDTQATGTTRVEGEGTRFEGSRIVTRDELLEGVASFDYGMIRRVTLEQASIAVETVGMDDAMIENLELACPGLTTVRIQNAPLSDIASSQLEALKAFASAAVMKIISEGQAEISLDVTFDRQLTASTVRYIVELGGINVRAGLNL